ncbi:MAG: hypothetical protein MZU97_03330 [Bacillus subtilis]|nr:hypothetical protein [Bacillus subtilis]
MKLIEIVVVLSIFAIAGVMGIGLTTDTAPGAKDENSGRTSSDHASSMPRTWPEAVGFMRGFMSRKSPRGWETHVLARSGRERKRDIRRTTSSRVGIAS